MTRCIRAGWGLFPFSLPASRIRPTIPLPQSICLRKLNNGSFARRSSTTAPNHRIEYNWIKGVETLEEYQPGGYHPVMVGDILNGRYQIVDKLGFGGYSTVWLAHDTRGKKYVALKVNIADGISRETKVLRDLSGSLSLFGSPGRRLVPSLLDEFEIEGPNGKHACYAVTLARCNLREISFSRLFPLKVARALCYGLVEAVAHIHSQGYVHGDIHLSNVLVQPQSSFDNLSIDELYKKYGEPEIVPITRCDGEPLPPNAPTKAVLPLFLGKYAEDFSLSDARPLLSDFGEAFAPNSEVLLGQDRNTPPAFRAPEAIFEPKTALTYSSDIWSLATALWEIMGMKAIFSTDFIPQDEIIAQHIDVLGPMPPDWSLQWEARSRFFDEDGQPTESYHENKCAPLEESFEICIQKWRRRWGGEIEAEERAMFLDLMRQMLAFRPEERPTAEYVLNSNWMAKWVLSDYEETLKYAM